MTLPTNVTYSTMIDQVKQWIKTNCINIANFGSLPACFKSGQTAASGSCTSTGHADYYNSTYTVKVSSNAVAQVAASTVDTQMTNFWTDYCGNININLNITPTNYLAFIEDMTSFCSARVYIACSEFSQNRYLIYNDGAATYVNNRQLTSSQQAYKLITATDIAYTSQGILINIINAVNQTLRLRPVYYSVTLT